MSDMSATTESSWVKLNCIALIHARELGPNLTYTRGRLRHTPPAVIEEDCKILGRAIEEELEARLNWYSTNHPELFEACSMSNWTDNPATSRSNHVAM